tara:strand:- start:86 stop:223 length:138 start_codon:yes stop_codon:yes gene_type:complete
MTKELALVENSVSYIIVALFVIYILYVLFDAFYKPSKRKTKGGGG